MRRFFFGGQRYSHDENNKNALKRKTQDSIGLFIIQIYNPDTEILITGVNGVLRKFETASQVFVTTRLHLFAFLCRHPVSKYISILCEINE